MRVSAPLLRCAVYAVAVVGLALHAEPGRAQPVPVPGHPVLPAGLRQPGELPPAPAIPSPTQPVAPPVPVYTYPRPVPPPVPDDTKKDPTDPKPGTDPKKDAGEPKKDGGAKKDSEQDPIDALRKTADTPASGKSDDTRLNASWRHGLRFESADKDFSLYVGGRAHFDTVGYLTTTAMRESIPGNVPLEDGVSFRRVRLWFGGTIYKNYDFLVEFDFFNGFVTSRDENRLSNVPAPTDVWIQFKDLPYLGNLRVGNQKPLYSFEHLTSSRFLNFLERSPGFDAFAENQNNGFAPGIALRNTYADKRGTWGVGLFKNTRSVFGWNVGRNEAEVNGRVTFLPVYEDDGRYLVHVGVGAAHRDLDDDEARLRSRLSARNSPSAFAPLLADTGEFFGKQQQLLIPEFVVVAGPWSFQSEYYASWVGHARAVGPDDTPLADRGTAYFHSVYAEVHYFLTGEHRAYDRDTGAFTRVVPRRPLAWDRCGFNGCGAWQLTARYSYLDLNSKGVRGGEVHDMTLGVNWFLNPNMKIQWNYFLAHRRVDTPGGTGLIHGFAVRTALDF